jgi:type II secretory pathway predicted ATPase ExeA
MKHLRQLGLSEDPFRNDHHEKFNVDSASQSDALRRLDRAVRQGRGLTVLIGAVGSGKTQVARRLYEELEEEVFEAGMMVVLRDAVDADWLLARFASQLGVEQVAGERDALIAQIYERLAIIREDGRHAVLIVDDAHALATRRTLLELCGLVKLEYEDRRLLSVVLAGAPPLLEALAADPLLAHHVDVRVTLRPFERDEVDDYLAARIHVAGGNPSLVLPGASVALHELSDGHPGRINTLADNALFEAYVAGHAQLTRSDVERAYAELGWGEVGAYAPPTPQAARAVPSEESDELAAAGDLEAESSFSSSAVAPAADREFRSRPAAAEVTAPDAGTQLADLDTELEAVFEPEPGVGSMNGDEASQTVLMDFEAGADLEMTHRPLPPSAMAAATEIQLEPGDALDPLPKDDDEVDDLFMELLDD